MVPIFISRNSQESMQESFTALDKDLVIKLAEAKVEQISKRVSDERHRLLASYTNDVNNGFFHKMFNVSDLHIDNAEKHLFKNTGLGYCIDYQVKLRIMKSPIEKIERLIRLANVSEGTIQLSASDFSLVTLYHKK